MADVILVAPVRANREAICLVIESNTDLRVTAHSSSFRDAWAEATARPPDVTLLDFNLPEFLSVLSLVKSHAPSTAAVAFGIDTHQEHTQQIVRAAEAGLNGFVDADQPLRDIVDAVRLVTHAGAAPCSPRIASILLHDMKLHPRSAVVGSARGRTMDLTARELEVAKLASAGLTNRQIATRLVLGESTVKTHIHSALAKLGVTNRSQIDTETALTS